jgi:hypothetical protein
MLEIFNIEVQVSFFHLAGFIVVVSLCFLFNRQTLGLLSAFLFVFNWSSFANKEIILGVLKYDPYYWLVYLGGGAVLACLAGLGVMATEREFKLCGRNELARGPGEEELYATELEAKTGVLYLTREWKLNEKRGRTRSPAGSLL